MFFTIENKGKLRYSDRVLFFPKMVALNTPEAQIGFTAPDFNVHFGSSHYSLSSISGPNGTVIIFMCNHCPYVKKILPDIVRDAALLAKMGVGVVAIMPNDIQAYPDDNIEKMLELSSEYSFSFPYIPDLDQSIVKSYGAVCTPDFFGFNSKLELQYRGRLVDPETGKHELLESMKEVVSSGKTLATQKTSIGCSIKWKSDC